VIIRTYIPEPPLLDFVELFWLYEGFTQPEKERALPTGTVELVINLREDRLQVFDRQNTDRLRNFRGSMICGPHSEFFVIESGLDELILGVHFKPGGARPFLKVPTGELHNAHVSLDTLWGAKAVALRDRLLDPKTPEARFRILEQCLMAQVAWPWAWHPAVAFALKEFQGVPHARTISDVAEQIGISQRRFIQVFRDEVGLTPKLFCRVRRFQEVLRLIGRGRVEWVDVALACGYYDQAHFINDFQAFSGLNPTAYVTHREDRNPTHVSLTV
jgi:AraC-like DNA-binding protein